MNADFEMIDQSQPITSTAHEEVKGDDDHLMTRLDIEYEAPELLDDAMVMGEFNNWNPVQMLLKFEDQKMIYYYQTNVPEGFKYRF